MSLNWKMLLRITSLVASSTIAVWIFLGSSSACSSNQFCSVCRPCVVSMLVYIDIASAVVMTAVGVGLC